VITQDQFVCIPEPLRRIDHWVVRCGKVPQAIRSIGSTERIRAFPGNAHDPANWMPAARAAARAEVLERAHGGEWGIGFVPVEGDDIGFVDLDGCREPGPQPARIASWARYVMERFRPAYAEASTSWSGIKILVRGASAPRVRQHAVVPYADDLRVDSKEPFVEMYSAHQFTTVTGRHLTGSMAELIDCRSGWSWLEKLMAGPGARVRRGHAALHVSDADLAEVQSALMAFTSDNVDRSEFAGFASVLKDQFGDEGWPVFEAWMAQSPLDDSRATRKLWDGAKPSRRMTTSSIFWHARQHGWRPKSRVADLLLKRLEESDD
jgi:hypothetical protein